MNKDQDHLAAAPEQRGELPEPAAWEGTEGWEALAWHLCADENGEDACNELVWEGGPIPEPWGDRWLKYEGEAKRMIELVGKYAGATLRQHLAEAVRERDVLRSVIQSALNNNGGPIDADSTLDGKSYVMVHREDFDAIDAASRVAGT